MSECDSVAAGGRPRCCHVYFIEQPYSATSQCLDVWTICSSQNSGRTCRRLLWLIYSQSVVLTHLLLLSSHHRHGQDKTLSSYPCRWCEQNSRQVKTVFSTLHCISTLDKTVWKISVVTVLTCCQFRSYHRHGQDKTVLSSPCWRCELGITVI